MLFRKRKVEKPEEPEKVLRARAGLRLLGTAEAIMRERDKLLEKFEQAHPKLRSILENLTAYERKAEIVLSTDPLEANRLIDFVNNQEQKLNASLHISELRAWYDARRQLKIIFQKLDAALIAERVIAKHERTL